MLTSPRDYFYLTNFRQVELFSEEVPVWQALDAMEGYLEQFHNWRLLGLVSPGAIVEGPVFLGNGSVVEPGAMIIGPTILGEQCVVRQGAYIRGNVIAGDHCIIGHCSEVKGSILLNEARAPHFNYVGDSILGNDTNLGAGVVLANLRLDEAEVKAVDAAGERVPSGRRKFGAIIGDGARIACNLVLNPGTLIPPHSQVVPGANPPVIRNAVL